MSRPACTARMPSISTATGARSRPTAPFGFRRPLPRIGCPTAQGGRWVFVDGIWAWAPGPVVQRAVYAPALVVFFGGPSVRVAIGTPFVSWVALGWGEPVVPWWGRSGFAGRPSWRGWGGPRIVNNVVVNQNTVVNVNTINVYRNVSVHNAVVAVSQEHFGRTPVHEARMTHVDVQRLEPVRGQLRVTPEASSFVAASGPARRPPE